MTLCNCKCACSLFSIVVGLILGVIAAFLQITGTIAVSAVFLWVLAGVAVGYLGILLLSAALQPQGARCGCTCAALNTVLAGIAGTVFFAAVLLAVDIPAASVTGAILVGLLAASFVILISSAACLIRNLFDCGN